MDSERWQDVKRIFEGALDRDPAQRLAYVAEACDDDQELLAEVHSLLRSLDDAGDFMEQSPVRDVAGQIAEGRAGVASAIAPGVTLSRYRVVGSIGRGGMGEVYKAWDSALDRPIALKILPPDLVQNADRLRRFVQEAKSASSLNHPHIITIHDVGETRLQLPDGDSSVHYIAMEYIDGETLRKKIEEGGELREIVSWFGQAADGVAKAHAAGIVHRDLKPDNIMITHDGYAKVLDFGLAKLVVRDPALPASDGNSPPDVTREGMILGTLAYMSPEQIRGKTVDGRSDIFAFGCMLYEAATRRRPFSADSEVDLIHKIVHDKPRAIEELNPNVPADLRRIIRRCLAKEPEQRYQSMKDLGLELRELSEDWDQRSLLSDPGQTPTLLMEQPRPRRSWWIPAVIALALAVAIGGAIWWRATRAPAFTLDKLQISSLTNSGNIVVSAISPDGHYLAYATYDHDTYSLWLKQIATGSAVEIVPPSRLRIARVSFAPDSDYVYFTQRIRMGISIAALYRLPVLGGSAVKLIDDIDTAPSFAPDGKQFAFVRRRPGPNDSQLIVVPAAGGAERVVAREQSDSGFDAAAPAWTPDGKRLVAAMGGSGGSDHERLAFIDLKSGERTPLGNTVWRKLSSFAWLPQANGLLVVGDPDRDSAPSKVWFVSARDGNLTRIYADANDHWSISLTNDGRAIALSQRTYTGALFSCDLNGEHLQRVSAPDLVLRTGDVDPNGLAFTGERDGVRSLWVIDETGTPHEVPNAVQPGFPTTTADRRTVLYWSKASGRPHLYVINADGSGLRQVTNGPNDSIGGISPDGRSFVYVNESGNIVERALNGNGSRVIAGHASTFASYSIDGKHIGTTRFVSENGRVVERRGELLDAKSGAVLATAPLRGVPGWGPEGKFATLLDDNIVVDGTPITHFTSGRTYDFGLLPDQKHLMLIRGDQRDDVVMLTNLR